MRKWKLNRKIDEGMSNPKCGGMYFTAGYDAPTVILFDEKNQFTKKLFDGLEGMY